MSDETTVALMRQTAAQGAAERMLHALESLARSQIIELAEVKDPRKAVVRCMELDTMFEAIAEMAAKWESPTATLNQLRDLRSAIINALVPQ